MAGPHAYQAFPTRDSAGRPPTTGPGAQVSAEQTEREFNITQLMEIAGVDRTVAESALEVCSPQLQSLPTVRISDPADRPLTQTRVAGGETQRSGDIKQFGNCHGQLAVRPIQRRCPVSVLHGRRPSRY